MATRINEANTFFLTRLISRCFHAKDPEHGRLQAIALSGIWHRANVHEPPNALEEKRELEQLAANTISCKLAVSDGFKIGTACWHYPTRSWCHKSYEGSILFWCVMPSWENTGS